MSSKCRRPTTVNISRAHVIFGAMSGADGQNFFDVKFIDDEQLLALFPSRSVALVGPPGNQKLLFLDGTDGVSVESTAR